MATIYQTTQMGEAHVLVSLVQQRGEADLLVHRVSSRGMAASEAHWFITRDRQSANTWVFFTSPGFAHVRIFFVDSAGEAGWQMPHRYRGRFK